MEVIVLLSVVLTAVVANELIVDDNVRVVNVERFGGDLPQCYPRQVCADVFNFIRDHGNGTGRRESRFIQNCRCSNNKPCGGLGTQLVFRETKTQSMVTCEEAEYFTECGDKETAKEQHNTPDGVFYQINCVCPNNEFPGNFYNKMTIKKTFGEMSLQEKMVAEAHSRSRYFRCRKNSEYRDTNF